MAVKPFQERLDFFMIMRLKKNREGLKEDIIDGYFIEDNEEDTITQPKNQETHDCSHFRAYINSSRNRRKDLDETGVVGAFCARHGSPIFLMNMKKGEKFYFADTILHRIQTLLSGSNSIFLYYDIICKYLPHIKVILFSCLIK